MCTRSTPTIFSKSPDTAKNDDDMGASTLSVSSTHRSAIMCPFLSMSLVSVRSAVWKTFGSCFLKNESTMNG